MLVADLLAWYDVNRRSFPWRAVSGVVSNPYHVWLSEIMLQQTTTVTVVPYFNQFIDKWPTVKDLASGSLDEILHAWQGLGYYSRARSLHKAAQMLKAHFPQTEEGLLNLPGVGPYTAAAIAAIAYDHPTAPVDGNIARIFARLDKIDEVKPHLFDVVKSSLKKVVPLARNGDFVQGLMDIGATICLPKEPQCDRCPLIRHCLSYRDKCQDQYPKQSPKKARPTRYGIAYWIQNQEGQVLIHKRPEKGLLGGMMGFPTTPWGNESEDHHLHGKLGMVEHTFTHFHLVLSIYPDPGEFELKDGLWVRPQDLHQYALPTLMKKVAKLAMARKVDEGFFPNQPGPETNSIFSLQEDLLGE